MKKFGDFEDIIYGSSLFHQASSSFCRNAIATLEQIAFHCKENSLNGVRGRREEEEGHNIHQGLLFTLVSLGHC